MDTFPNSPVPDACTILDALPAAVVVTEAALVSPGPRIVYVNAAFEAMTGYTSAEVIGRTPRLLQGQATDPAALLRLRAELDMGHSFHGETTNYRKDGTSYTVEWRIEPLHDADGRLTHWVSSQSDVTERKLAEAQVLHAITTHASEEGAASLDVSPAGLLPALQHLCDGAAVLYDVTCRLRFDRPMIPVSGRRAVRLYAAVRDAVLHAVADRGARDVTVSLSALGPAQEISISDDAPDVPDRESRALRAAARHAQALGAAFDVRSRSVMIQIGHKN